MELEPNKHEKQKHQIIGPEKQESVTNVISKASLVLGHDQAIKQLRANQTYKNLTHIKILIVVKIRLKQPSLQTTRIYLKWSIKS